MRSTLFTVALALASSAAAAGRPSVIRIGVASVGTGGRPVSGGTYGATAADSRALEREFEKDGIPVEYTYYSGAGPTVNEALANKQLDFAYQGDLPALVARAGGMRTRLILATNRWSAIYVGVPAASTARTLEDQPLLDAFYRAQYKRLLRSARALKLVRGDFDVDGWLDPTYLNRGIEALGLAGVWREQDADGRPMPVSVVTRP